MFMIFGYANGTDSVVDISKFIFKENDDDEEKQRKKSIAPKR